MTVQIKDILMELDKEAPFSLAEEWDNVGLLVGSPEQKVQSLLIGLDPTNSLIDEAIALKADTIITHHPVIFRPLPNINTLCPEGKLLEKVLSHTISIIACHTNLDSARDGVSDILARDIGLEELTPLIPTDEAGIGLGRVGKYGQPVAQQEFVNTVLSALKTNAVQCIGPMPETIQTVAVCGGSGSDFAEAAFNRGVDVYLSAEIKHATARWAQERNFCIIDGSHYGTEQGAVRLLAEKLQRICTTKNWNLEIRQTATEKSPFYCLQQK